jgi:hypothetical protein
VYSYETFLKIIRKQERQDRINQEQGERIREIEREVDRLKKHS